MKFVERNIEEDINISEPSELRYAGKIFVKIALSFFMLYMFLGILVDFVAPLMPVSWENVLGRALSSYIVADLNKCERYAEINIELLLNNLVADLPESQQRNYTAKIVKGDEVNAFALPGGYIVINSALMDMVESENELVMILGHEVGHFVARDHMRGLGRGFLFYIVTASIFGPNSSATRLFVNTSNFLANSYSRAQEVAADEFGLKLLVNKYGHAGGAVDFFEKLAEKEALPALRDYLSTHPSSATRVQILQDLIKRNNYPVKDTIKVYWNEEQNEDTYY